MWKETDLLADLAVRFKAVGSPTITTAEDDKGVTVKIVNVFDVAEDDKITPSAICKNISYYVFHAKRLDEAAYYHIQSLGGSIFVQAVERKVEEVAAIAATDAALIALPVKQ
jgi:hypothetical protein